MPKKPRKHSFAVILARRDIIPSQKLVSLALLKKSVLHMNELCQRTGLSRASCYTACHELAKKNLIYGPDKGFVVRHDP